MLKKVRTIISLCLGTILLLGNLNYVYASEVYDPGKDEYAKIKFEEFMDSDSKSFEELSNEVNSITYSEYDILKELQYKSYAELRSFNITKKDIEELKNMDAYNYISKLDINELDKSDFTEYELREINNIIDDYDTTLSIDELESIIARASAKVTFVMKIDWENHSGYSRAGIVANWAWNKTPAVIMTYDLVAFSWGNSFDVYENNSAMTYDVVDKSDNSIYKSYKVNYSDLQPNSGISFKFKVNHGPALLAERGKAYVHIYNKNGVIRSTRIKASYGSH